MGGASKLFTNARTSSMSSLSYITKISLSLAALKRPLSMLVSMSSMPFSYSVFSAMSNTLGQHLFTKAFSASYTLPSPVRMRYFIINRIKSALSLQKKSSGMLSR